MDIQLQVFAEYLIILANHLAPEVAIRLNFAWIRFGILMRSGPSFPRHSININLATYDLHSLYFLSYIDGA